MKTYQSVIGLLLAYNDRAHWTYDHRAGKWFIMSDDTGFDPAVTDDFGNLVVVAWNIRITDWEVTL